MANTLSMLTSADAVKQAMAECDELGRDAFLNKYGYKYSRLYPMRYDGRIYDSKAIAGVAFGKQHGSPLKARDFSGGVATVIPVLHKLGFSVGKAPHPADVLEIGKAYSRKYLVETFGGQLQSGIWTPKEFPVVFIFSGASGEAFGYKDGWTNDGIFEYTGEGQQGDMTFTAGNKAIRDHRQNGRDLFLFEDLGKGKGVRFAGLFECATVREAEGTDKSKQPRKIIVFDLVPVASAAEHATADDTPDTETPIQDLRAAAYSAAKAPESNRKVSDSKRTWYERSQKVRRYVLARANGVCEACDQPAPFTRRDGTPYLEPHHTTRLADEGPDHPASVGAICPNCHRKIHSGAEGAEWNERLKAKLTTREGQAPLPAIVDAGQESSH
jgi:5-methylcytosine-specific restriction protein A